MSRAFENVPCSVFDNEIENHYNLRHRIEFKMYFVNSVYRGS